MTQDSYVTQSYVTQSAWLATAGRADAIDEIADQFERPSGGAEAYWSSLELRRGTALRQTTASFAPRMIERRAG